MAEKKIIVEISTMGDEIITDSLRKSQLFQYRKSLYIYNMCFGDIGNIC